MKKLLVLMVLLSLSMAVFALRSIIRTGPFEMDTVDPEVTLFSPVGGEQWLSGSCQEILWEASDTNLEIDPIYIFYVFGEGDDDLSPVVLNNHNSGNYIWEVPEINYPIASIVVFARDIFGNVGYDFSEPLALVGQKPEVPSGLRLEIVNTDDVLISWDPVEYTIYGTSIVPDGYIVGYCQQPYTDDEIEYEILEDVTEGTSCLHEGVAASLGRMFYKVLAYKQTPSCEEPSKNGSLPASLEASIKRLFKNKLVGGLK